MKMPEKVPEFLPDKKLHSGRNRYTNIKTARFGHDSGNNSGTVIAHVERVVEVFGHFGHFL